MYRFAGTETRTYNDLLQLTRVTVPGRMDMEYRYTAGQNNGRISQSKDWISGEEVTYAYDSLQRLISAETTGPEWGQSFAYDGFGNLTNQTVTKGTAPSLSMTYDPSTNRPYGINFDANGNQSVGTWDIENRLVQQTLDGKQITWGYDPSNKRVMRYEPSVNGQPQWTFYAYGPGGERLAEITCAATGVCTSAGSNVYFGGKLIAGPGGQGVVTDRLGSVRARQEGGTWTSLSYYPWGQEKTPYAPDGKEKFGTYVRDSTASGQDYADQRYYSPNMGRFFSADPLGIGAADLKYPGTWNGYNYVGGDPVNLSDPSGLTPDGAFQDGCLYEGTWYPRGWCDTALSRRPNSRQRTPFERAAAALYAAQEGIAARTSISFACQKDLAALSSKANKEISLSTIQHAISHTRFENGTISTRPVSTFHSGPAGLSYQRQEDRKWGSGQTIADEFARNPTGLTAKTVLGGDTIFINPVLIGTSGTRNMALLFHEALHELGMIDEDIQAALGFPDPDNVTNTSRITSEFQQDCITGRGNY